MRTTEKVTVRPTKHQRYSFVVRWPGKNEAGEPIRVEKYFSNKTEANSWAKDRRAELGDVGESFGSISSTERAAVEFWRSFVASVPDAPPPPLLAILQEQAERWKATRSSVLVQAAVDAYEAAKTAEGLRPRSLQAIRTRCARFARDFEGRLICSITTAELSDWLLTLPARRHRGAEMRKAAMAGKPQQVGLLAKRNQRLALSGLFNYAKTRGWVRENPVTDASRPKPPKTRPGILRPGEVARLFAALEKAAPALVPFWAVRFFAGVREQECLRMDWSMIDLAAGEIHLPDTVTKTGHSRDVKIEPAAAAFLAPYAQPDGAIVTPSAMARVYHLRKAWRVLQAEDEAAKKKAKQDGVEAPRAFPVPMPANAARHSFATYHLAGFRHAGETSIQLGHGGSPELLHRHYKGIATEAEAKAFWSIRPTAPANVVPIGRPENAEDEQAAPSRTSAVVWPEPAALQAMLWGMPVVEIARAIGVSDVAVMKHAAKHGLAKPPRGHWLKHSPRKNAQ
jgi:integrase